MKGQAQDILIQDVSTGDNFVLTPPPPWGHLTVSGDISDCHMWGMAGIILLELAEARDTT